MEPLPQVIDCSNKIIKGVCSALIAFNDGFYGLEKVFQELHFLPGYFVGSGALKSYNKRVVNSSIKAIDAKKGQKTSKSSKEATFRHGSRKRKRRIV